MTNLLIPVGIPGSGKSTWTDTLFGHGKYSPVSSDAIRKGLWGSLRAAHDVSPEEKKERNREVWDIFYRRIQEQLEHGVDTIADGTNLRDHARDRLHKIGRFTNSKMHLVIFDNTSQAFGRNLMREADAVVPQDVMNDFYGQYKEAKMQIEKFEYFSWDSITVIGALY